MISVQVEYVRTLSTTLAHILFNYILGRIDLCETAITKKLDKSALGHIESLVVDLEKYSSHRRMAESKISSLEAETARLLQG